MTIAFTRLANGTTVVDRIVASGYRPPGAIWQGNVPPPHPSQFRATEFDFLGIVIPAGSAHLQGRRPQGTTPPSYYQLIKTTPGRSVCSWKLDRF